MPVCHAFTFRHLTTITLTVAGFVLINAGAHRLAVMIVDGCVPLGAIPADRIIGRLRALINLAVMLPILIMLYGRACGSHEIVLYAVFCVTTVAVQLALLLDTRWMTEEITAVRWFQSVYLVVCAMAALLNAAIIRHFSSVGSRRLFRFWCAVAFGFFYLAIDERFHLHEKAAAGMALVWGTTKSDVDGIGGVRYFDSWVLVAYLGAGAGLLFWCGRDLYREYCRRTLEGFRFFLLAGLLVVLSLVIDMKFEHYPLMEEIEELLELSAWSIFLVSFLLNAIEFARADPFLSDVVARYQRSRRS